MQRLPDWRARLTAYIVKCTSMPFEPGVHDGALFAAGAVEAQCDEDHAAEFRRRYRSIRGGLRLVKWAGYADHVAIAAAILPDRPRALARPGDIAVLTTGAETILGVVQGEMIYVLTPTGLGLQPITAAERILGVG